MDARGDAKLKLQLKYNVIGGSCSNEFQEMTSNMELGLGWLRAVPRCYNYNYKNCKLGNNFQRNVRRLDVTWNWGVDGCARWRNVTSTVTITYNCGIIYKGI